MPAGRSSGSATTCCCRPPARSRRPTSGTPRRSIGRAWRTWSRRCRTAWLPDDPGRRRRDGAQRAAYVRYLLRRLEAPRAFVEEAERARSRGVASSSTRSYASCRASNAASASTSGSSCCAGRGAFWRPGSTSTSDRLAAFAPGLDPGQPRPAPRGDRADRAGRPDGRTDRPAGPGGAIPLAGRAGQHDHPAVGGPHGVVPATRPPSSTRPRGDARRREPAARRRAQASLRVPEERVLERPAAGRRGDLDAQAARRHAAAFVVERAIRDARHLS